MKINMIMNKSLSVFITINDAIFIFSRAMSNTLYFKCLKRYTRVKTKYNLA